MPRIRTGIILAAGYGTRFLPATKAVPKEMLPLLDRPVIQYVVEEAIASGLDQIVIVTSDTKKAVEDHFDRNRRWKPRWRTSPTSSPRSSAPARWNVAFVRQKEMRGQAHAIAETRFLLGDEPFALFYPDDVIFGEKPAMRQLIDVHEKHGGNVLAVQRVPKKEIVHYGSIDAEPVEDRVYRAKRIVEKPTPEEAPSDLGTVGRYVCTSDIWPLLEADAAQPQRRDVPHRHLHAGDGPRHAPHGLRVRRHPLRHRPPPRPPPGLDLRRPPPPRVAPGLREYLKSLELT